MNWPVGLGGKGNEGVTQQVKQVEGAIGYVELIYALSNNLPLRRQIKNARGQLRRAVARVGDRRGGRCEAAKRHRFPGVHHQRPRRGRPTRSPRSPGSWSTRTTRTPAKAKLIKDFLTWMITPEAQTMAAELKYAPLPKDVVTLIEARLPTLKAGGKAIAAR